MEEDGKNYQARKRRAWNTTLQKGLMNSGRNPVIDQATLNVIEVYTYAYICRHCMGCTQINHG